METNILWSNMRDFQRLMNSAWVVGNTKLKKLFIAAALRSCLH